jgi:hypothetical protein
MFACAQMYKYTHAHTHAHTHTSRISHAHTHAHTHTSRISRVKRSGTGIAIWSSCGRGWSAQPSKPENTSQLSRFRV